MSQVWLLAWKAIILIFMADYKIFCRKLWYCLKIGHGPFSDSLFQSSSYTKTIVLCVVTPFSLVEIYLCVSNPSRESFKPHSLTYDDIHVLSFVEIHLARSELVHEQILQEVGLLQKVPQKKLWGRTQAVLCFTGPFRRVSYAACIRIPHCG